MNLKGVSPYVCILSGYFYLGLPSFQISLLRPELPSLPFGPTRLLVSPSLHSYALLVSTSHSSHRASTSSTEILFVLLPTSSALPPRYSPSHFPTKLFPPFSNSLSLFLSSRCKYSTLLTSSLCLAVFLLKLYDKSLHLTSYSRPSWYIHLVGSPLPYRLTVFFTLILPVLHPRSRCIFPHLPNLPVLSSRLSSLSSFVEIHSLGLTLITLVPSP